MHMTKTRRFEVPYLEPPYNKNYTILPHSLLQREQFHLMWDVRE